MDLLGYKLSFTEAQYDDKGKMLRQAGVKWLDVGIDMVRISNDQPRCYVDRQHCGLLLTTALHLGHGAGLDIVWANFDGIDMIDERCIGSANSDRCIADYGDDLDTKTLRQFRSPDEESCFQLPDRNLAYPDRRSRHVRAADTNVGTHGAIPTLELRTSANPSAQALDSDKGTLSYIYANLNVLSVSLVPSPPRSIDCPGPPHLDPTSIEDKGVPEDGVRDRRKARRPPNEVVRWPECLDGPKRARGPFRSSDSTRPGFAMTQFAIGTPFSAFNTYIIYQMQIVGYTIGNEPGQPRGSGCSLLATACEVPFGTNSFINYVSFNNYINVITYVSTGVLILALSGIGDRMGYKREQYVLLTIAYAALALPSAALTKVDSPTFAALAALYVVFNLLGFLAGNWGKYVVPYVMFSCYDDGKDEGHPEQPSGLAILPSELLRATREVKGTKAAVWGSNALSIGQIAVLLLTIGISYVSASSAGLYLTSRHPLLGFTCRHQPA
ncbi:hypothetical protein L1887_51335 [Cichorium endivia]|nr:hypothetical protein L1887_51335 [Cichorium endivia]